MKYFATSKNMQSSSYQYKTNKCYGHTRDAFLDEARRDLGTMSLPMLPKLSGPTHSASAISPYCVKHPLRPRAHYTKKSMGFIGYGNYNQRVVSSDEDDELIQTNTRQEQSRIKRIRTQDYRYDCTTRAISPPPRHQNFQTETLNLILPPDILQRPVCSFEIEDGQSPTDDGWKSKSILDCGEDAEIIW